MNELLSALQQRINQQVTIIFYHRTNGIVQSTADATYVLYLRSATVDVQNLTAVFSNGMSGNAESVLTVVLPSAAEITSLSESEWQADYAANSRELRVRFLFQPKLTAQPSQIHVNKPTVKEIKDDAGNLIRLYLETPEEGATIDFLKSMKQVVEQLLTTWQVISVKSTSEDLEEFPDEMTFKSIELVSLPGNVFFELITTSTQGERSIEVATTMTLDFQKSTISYELEGASYEIHKVS
jgi:hypothetical protein